MVRRRNPRVDAAVREAVARLLDSEIADPRVAFVTVTDARVTEDQRQATIFYTTVDPALVARPARRGGGDAVPAPAEVAAGLASAAPRVQSLLGGLVRLRNTPQLTFEPDPVAERGQRIDTLLREIHQEGS